MEDNIINFKCEYCGCEKGIKKENAVMIYSECLNCKAPTFLESKDEVPQNRKPLNIPKCPTCGSINVEKISMNRKVGGAMLFGLFSSDVRNTMHCKNCGYKW